MRAAYDVEQIRRAEAALMAAVAPGTLMQRAAAGLAATCARLLGDVYGARVVILVGGGDNGGDALFAGARLAARGARVDAVLLTESAHAEGLAAFRRSGGRQVVWQAGPTGAAAPLLARADLVLDGITGIGGRGGLRAEAAAAAGAVIADCAVVVAVDVPSGVDASTGEVAGAAVRADVTVTFGAWKLGLLVDPGATYAGVVELVDIGLGPHLRSEFGVGAVHASGTADEVGALQAGDVAALLPQLANETDKYTRGVVGVVAGSDTYSGAAVLATGGALAAGPGMVRYVGERGPAGLVRARWPEVLVTELPGGATDGARAPDGIVEGAGRVQAWVVGPGLGTGPVAADLLEQVLAADLPTVVDADGLTLLGHRRELLARRTATTVLTPHAGELARLLDADRADIEAHRLQFVRRAAAALGCVVLLKGSTTVIADPDGHLRVNPTGTSWLATAGSGDVLAGATGALLATGLAALDAAAVGAWLHGAAGRWAAGGGHGETAAGGAPINAADLVDAWPQAVRSLAAVADLPR